MDQTNFPQDLLLAMGIQDRNVAPTL